MDSGKKNRQEKAQLCGTSEWFSVHHPRLASGQARRAEGRGKEGFGSWHESGEVRRGLSTENLLGCGAEGKTESRGLCLMCDFFFPFLPLFVPSFHSPRFLPGSPHLLPHTLPPPPGLYLFPHRKIKTNYFIVSLAFADLLVSVLVMPFGAIELVQDIWAYGEMF